VETALKKNYFMPILLFILAYEWLISAADKLTDKSFYKDLHQQMVQAIPDIQNHFYATLVKNVGIPHYMMFGTLVEAAEVFVGVSFILLGVFMLKGKLGSVMKQIGIFTCIVAAFMSANYFLLGGDSFFVNQDNAFQEGISIDIILMLIELSLTGYFVATLKQVKVMKSYDGDNELTA
jgi:thiosulfate dehydrogenase (quinone) large subunit